MARSMKLTVLVLAALALGGFFGARLVARSLAAPRAPGSRAQARSAAVPVAPRGAPSFELHVPRLHGAIVLDGDMDDSGWAGNIARTGSFLAPSGLPARPYSDARMVWGDGFLYVALYAADEDVRAQPRVPDSPVWLDDAFHLAFTSSDRVERTLDVSVLGVVTDAIRRGDGPADYAWQSGVHVAHENDGTLNDATDDDEEWVLELAIPLESLGLKGDKGERVGFSVRRCDTPKGLARVCGSWGEGESQGAIVLD